MFRTLSILVLLLIVSVSAFAQVSAVPQLMNFQGRLTRSDGTPVPNGNYSIRFSLWTAATGGTEKWNQTVSTVTVRNGTFGVLLNTSTGAVDKFNNNLFLEIKIGTDAPLTPRQQLVTVAYAFKANSVKDGSITSASIANGTLTAEDFAPDIFNPLAWLLGGNSGVTGGFLGTTDDQPLELRVNNRRAMRYSYAENTATAGFEYRSSNVLGGSDINSIGAGIVGATIAGGGADFFSETDVPNQVTGDFGTVGGGYSNIASGLGAVIGGGGYNTADGFHATVGGGQYNIASGDGATIGGGGGNVASGLFTTLGGGQQNTVSEQWATIGGGVLNIASRRAATVVGGQQNTASGQYATVGGGRENIAAGDFSFAAGYQAQANHIGCFVWNDRYESFASTNHGQFLIRAGGGVGINTNNPAGFALNVAGNIQCVSLTQTSDARYKQNVATFDNALECILNLRGVTFDWKPTEGRDFADGKQIGFLAQEVEKILPELVTTDSNGYKSVAYQNVVPVLVEAVKTLNSKVERLKKIETENAELKARLEAIEAALAALKPESEKH
jgi:hypothetical protein